MKSTNETLKSLGNGPCFRCGTSTAPPFRTFTALEPATGAREWCANCFNNDLPGSPFLSQHYGQTSVNCYILAPGVHNVRLQLHTPGPRLNHTVQPPAPSNNPVVSATQLEPSVLGMKKKRADPPMQMQEKPSAGRSHKEITTPCFVCESTASWEWHTHLYAEDKDPENRKWCAKCYRADHHRKTTNRREARKARKAAKEQGRNAGGGKEVEQKNGDQQTA